MKMNIYLSLKQGVSNIPEKYQHYLSEDINYCVNKVKSKGSVLYSFSQLIGTKRLDNGCFEPNEEFVWFEFSSPDVMLFNEIIKNLFIKRYVIDSSLEVSHIEYIDEEIGKCTSNYAFFSSISPITLYDKMDNKRVYYIPDIENKFKVGPSYEIVYDTKKCVDKIKNIITHNLRKCGIMVDESEFDVDLIHTYKHKNYVAKLDGDKIIRTFGFFAYVKISAACNILSHISDLGIGNSLGLGFGHIKRHK